MSKERRDVISHALRDLCTAPACFGTIRSFTDRRYSDKDGTRLQYVSVEIKDITLATRILSEPVWPFR